MRDHTTQRLRERTAQILDLLDTPIGGVTRTSLPSFTQGAAFYAAGAACWVFAPALAGALSVTLNLRAVFKGFAARREASAFAAADHSGATAPERSAMQVVWDRWSRHIAKSAVQSFAFSTGAGLMPAIQYALGIVVTDPLHVVMQAVTVTGSMVTALLTLLAYAGFWVKPLNQALAVEGH